MAEGLINHFLGDRVSAYSGGTEATSVNPNAIAAMAELGIDISRQSFKDVDEFEGEEFDYVITLVSDAQEKCLIHGAVSYCGRCGEACPHLEQTSHGRKRLYFYGFSDLSKAFGEKEQVLAEFRKTRDDIKTRILQFFQ
jgi:arsenate reductase